MMRSKGAAVAIGMAVAVGGSAEAQDTAPRTSYLMTADELVALIDTDRASATAFIDGAIGGLLLRSLQGDSSLGWLRECYAQTFVGAADLFEDLRTWTEANPADAPPADMAANAVQSVLATVCGDTSESEPNPPQ